MVGDGLCIGFYCQRGFEFQRLSQRMLGLHRRIGRDRRAPLLRRFGPPRQHNIHVQPIRLHVREFLVVNRHLIGGHAIAGIVCRHTLDRDNIAVAGRCPGVQIEHLERYHRGSCGGVGQLLQPEGAGPVRPPPPGNGGGDFIQHVAHRHLLIHPQT